MILPLVLLALPCVHWTQGVESAEQLRSAGVRRVCVPPDRAAAWTAAGFDAQPLADAELTARSALPVPRMRPRAERASPTRSPWLDANGWRFRRDPGGRYVYELPAGTAALAAAEAAAYGADAVLKVDPADLEAVGRMVAFVSELPPNELADVADLGVVDDGSALLGEVLNLLSRRNLLFRIVKEPSPALRLTLKLGTPEYPARAAADPSGFVLALRRRLGDEQRALRLFGSEAVICRLTGDGGRARLHLLNYSGRELEGLRVRLRGSYAEGVAYVAGKGRLALDEVAVADGATEFTLGSLGPYGVVDLPSVK